MMGRLDRSASRSCTVRLEELVPIDHLLRRVDQLLDLTSVVAELRPYYASTGRPSIAPELMQQFCNCPGLSAGSSHP